MKTKTINMNKLLFAFIAAGMLVFQACNSTDSKAQPTAEDASEAPVEKVSSSNETHGTIQLTKEGFIANVMDYESNPEQWVFKGDKPCIIDFYADWCAPCRITSPILEDLALEYGDKINIYKVDTEKERELAAVFGIRSIPSFLYCPIEGKPFMASGIARTEEETKEMFKSNINQHLLNITE